MESKYYIERRAVWDKSKFGTIVGEGNNKELLKKSISKISKADFQRARNLFTNKTDFLKKVKYSIKKYGNKR